MNNKAVVKMIKVLWLCLVAFTNTTCSAPATAFRRSNQGTRPLKPDATFGTKVEKIANVPFRDYVRPPKLQFINERDGWLSADARLWRTHNSGKTWELVFTSNAEVELHFVDGIEFVNSQVGWISVFDEIYKTESGGDSWKQITSPFSEGAILWFKFLEDGKQGWAAGIIHRPATPTQTHKFPNKYTSSGDEDHYYQVISYTNDGGKSWQPQLFPSSVGIATWYWSDEGHLWAFGDSIYYWEKGNWIRIDYSKASCDNSEFIRNFNEDHPFPYAPSTVFFLNRQIGWISYTNGYIAKTRDGGQTWCDLLDPGNIWPVENSSTYFKKLYFSDEMNGWGLDAGGTLYETKNGGSIWTKIETIIGFDEIHLLDANHGWAISKEGLFRINP